MTDSILEIKNFSVSYGDVKVLNDVSFDVGPGEIVALVGRSGAGKSTLLSAIMQMLPGSATVAGEINVDGRRMDLTDKASWRNRVVSFVPQDPFSWFNPLSRISSQIGEMLGLNGWRYRAKRHEVSVRHIEKVGIKNANRVARAYPHQLSGGMRQRVAIACALVNDPVLVLADEPTSSLDVESRDQILELLKECRDAGRAVLLVSHDRRLVDGLSDRILYINDGKLVGEEEHAQVVMPALRRSEITEQVMECKAISQAFKTYEVLTDFSLTVGAGETVAVVGESGIGKSTFCRIAAGVIGADKGSVYIKNEVVHKLSRETRAKVVQMQFQDTRGSFDDRMTVRDSIAIILRAANVPLRELDDRIEWACEVACFPYEMRTRVPRQLSGGQIQRAAIARAIAVRPAVLILDEPFNALDVETCSEVATNLAIMQQELGTAIIAVMHDLDLVAGFAHRTVSLS